jgi:predicted Zn finger-like uncharacterized protein
MAKLSVSCPSCRTRYRVEEALLGRKARCAQCRTRFRLVRPAGDDAVSSSPWPWVSGPAPGGGATTLRTGRPGPAEEVAEQWRPGDVVLDLYEVRDVFTSGGMGLVYRVWHRGWNVELAVKCPRPEFFREEQDKENFEREAETWVKLGLHPHTVTCYYVRRLGGIPRVFAEYVGGGSLAEGIRGRRLYQGGPARALARLLDVAVQFAWGLEFAHEQGLIHRDVKPGNVLLTPSGVAKVTDFGMARARGGALEIRNPKSEIRNAEGAAGQSVLVSAGGLTPAFCSPEQVLGESVSRKTDVWSWGVSVLEMFTGPATWSAGYLAADVLDDLLRHGPPDPALPPLPVRLAELLRHCFRRDPAERPRDMAEVAAAVRAAYEEATGAPYPRPAPPTAGALPDLLNNRAVSLLDLKKQDEAEQLWEKALAAAPNHPEAAYNLGLARWRAGRLGDAELVTRLREVCATHPGDWLPLYLLAGAHLELGAWGQAAATLEQIQGTAARLDEVRQALAVARERAAGAGRRVRAYEGHRDWVSSVALAADGRLALSGGADRTLRLWEAATGQCLRVFEGHTEWVTAVALAADGRLALSGGADATVRLWDAATGECLRVLETGGKWVLAVALSPDGRLALGGGGEGLLRTWDLAEGGPARTLPGHVGPVLAVALGGDGRLALSGGRDGTAKLWDLARGECLRTFAGHEDKVHAVGLAADGRQVLTGSADRTLKLWDAETGRCLCTLEGHGAAVMAAGLSGGGHHALSGSADRTLKFWRLGPARCLATLEGHAGGVNSVALDATGRYALSGSGDRTLALWRLPVDVRPPYLVSRVLGSEAALAGWADYEQALARAWQALSSGDARAAARWVRAARAQPGYGRRPEATDQWGALYVRLARAGLEGGWERHALEGHLGAVTAVAAGADGRLALSGSADRTLKVWEVATGHCLRTLEGHGSVVTAVCLSADGRFVLSGSADATLKLWDVDDGRCLRTFEGHDDVVTAVALSADGRLALSGGADRTVRLWDVGGGRCLHAFAGHEGPVHAACLSGDGRLAVSGSGQFLIRHDSERLFTSGQLRLWDVGGGRCLHAFSGHADAVTAACLSFDGRYALCGGGRSVFDPRTGKSSQSGQLDWWELPTGRRLAAWTAHDGAVTAVCLTADGRYALSAGTDRAVKVWDVARGECLRTFAGHGDAVTSLAVSRDGRYALSGGADRLLKVWALDWALEDNAPADWDEGARPYLEGFLAEHTPYAAPPPPERKGAVRALLDRSLGRRGPPPSAEGRANALTRQGKPAWNEEDFERLLHLLGCAGYGWLLPEGVRRRLGQMARTWDGPPPMPG